MSPQQQQNGDAATSFQKEVRTWVWQSSCRKKRADRERLITPFKMGENRVPAPEVRRVVDFFEWKVNEDLLTDEEFAMTEVEEVEVVLGNLREGKWRCVDLVKAYIRRATIIHQLTNCLTEVMFEQAISRAVSLDALPTDKRGSLHGLPVTLKDQFNVPGFDSTIGYASFIGNAASLPPSALVEILQSQGAIVFAKTNVPQSLMWCETENNVWGRTDNPRDTEFTPGGSTGGEAVLLAMKGSLVGWGTDIGGSLRIPSALVGCWALRPSSHRFPYYGVSVSNDGQEHVPSVVGPMARSIDSLTHMSRHIISSNAHYLDPRVVPIPWREDIYQSASTSKKLRIGLLLDDGVVRIHPPILRQLTRATTVLSRAGHEIVPWNSDLHEQAITLMNEFYKADGGSDVRSAIEASGEDYIEHCKRLFGAHMAGGKIDIADYWKLSVRKRELQKAYLNRWDEAGLDLLLAPVMPHVAVRHTSTGWVGYTKVWNVLDYTAGVIPNFGFVTADAAEIHKTDFEWKEYVPRNPFDEANWRLYDPEAMNGHPIGIQVVGPRYAEEKVLGGMKLFYETLRGNLEILDRAHFGILAGNPVPVEGLETITEVDSEVLTASDASSFVTARSAA